MSTPLIRIEIIKRKWLSTGRELFLVALNGRMLKRKYRQKTRAKAYSQAVVRRWALLKAAQVAARQAEIVPA